MLLPRRVLALQWISNIKMRRMLLLLACFLCRITLWSLFAEAALPVLRKEGSSRAGSIGTASWAMAFSWFGTAGKQNMGAAHPQPGMSRCIIASSSDELLAPSGEQGIDEYELFPGDKQRDSYRNLACWKLPNSCVDSRSG
jgi:hypothetical protein